MGEAWDVPPFPKHGDNAPDDTCKWVGRCLTEWEEMEHVLSTVYSQFCRNPQHIPTMREYGAPNIFRERKKRLEEAAESFFIRHCNQKVEGDFASLLDQIAHYSDRRNEIAHGVVRPLQWIWPHLPVYEAIRDGALQYALIPALYTHKKLDETHRPRYIYTANELEYFCRSFYDLRRGIYQVHLAILDILQPPAPERPKS